MRAAFPFSSRRKYSLARRTRAERTRSTFAIVGECNGKMRSTPWPNDTFLTVKVDRVLEHGDTVQIGGTTLRAVHNPGHTQGTTTWMMTVEDGGRRYNVAIRGSLLPDWGVSLIKNPRHKNVVADTRLGLSRMKAEKAPDIVLPSHAQSFFEGKIEQTKAGVRPHPLLNGDEWMSDIMEAEADFERAVWAEEQGS